MSVPRTYNPSVLEGNWLEERSHAPPLRNNIPDFGFRDYNSTHSTVFLAPDPKEKHVFSRHKTRCGMLTSDTWNEASYAMTNKGGHGAPQMTLRNTIRPFDLTHGGRDVSPDEIKATFTTTTREAMKEGVGIGVAAAIAEEKGLKTFLRGPHAPPAGGPGSIPEGRGKRTSGVTGEILNLSDDARVNTLAQRSWMYAPDAALTAILNPKKEPSPHETTSLPGLEGGEASHIYSCITKAPLGSTHGMHSAFQAAPRIRTDVTLTRDRIGGTRAARGKVFMDDP